MNFIKRKGLDRRTLIKGAGFSLALPFLDAMIPTVTAAPIPEPKLAFIYFPHGAIMSTVEEAIDRVTVTAEIF